MDTLTLLILLLTLVAGLVTIICWYWGKILVFGRPVTKNSRNFSAENLSCAAAGKIGLAIVIANQYEGTEKLNGTAKDKERWEKVFEYLQFDVRTSGEVGLNASKEEMLKLCNLPQKIPIRQKDRPNYHFIAFVFSGHGYRDTSNNDIIVSQDGKSLSLESEVFPCLFGGRRGDWIKLIFIDACRSDPSQEKLSLTKSHVEKALKHSNHTAHPAPDFTDDAFIAFATLKGFPAEDDSCGSIFTTSFTNLLQTDISLVNAMTKVTEEVLNSPTLHYFRPMSVNMLSCEVNLYQSAKSVMGPAPNPKQGQIPAPDPNLDQHQNMDQGSQIPATNLSTSSDMGGNDNLSSDEEIIQTPLPESGDVVMPSSQTGDPPVGGSQQNRSIDSATDVTESEAETIPSTPQPPSSRHPPSSESQTVDQTARDEDLDGPAAPGQLSNTDHGTDSHVLNSPIQASQDSPCHSPPEPRGHHSMVLPPLQASHKHQDPPVPINSASIQQEENVPGGPPVADEQPQQIQVSGQNNRYQVVPEGAGIHSKPHKDPNKLAIRALMPYIGELASLGLQISGWLDISSEWVTISKTPGTPVEHLQQLLMEWLNRDEDPDVPHTWKHFISVVRNCKRGQLAEKMEREVFERPHPSPSGPAVVHDPSTTVQGPHPSPSGPAVVHDPSTTVQDHTHPVLDSTPSESEINQKVGSRMSALWDQFAIQLSFDANTRNKIKKNNLGNCDECFSNVVCLWLERSAGSKDVPRTWRTVLEAVRRSGQLGVADDVRKALLADHTED